MGRSCARPWSRGTREYQCKSSSKTSRRSSTKRKRTRSSMTRKTGVEKECRDVASAIFGTQKSAPTCRHSVKSGAVEHSLHGNFLDSLAHSMPLRLSRLYLPLFLCLSGSRTLAANHLARSIYSLWQLEALWKWEIVSPREQEQLKRRRWGELPRVALHSTEASSSRAECTRSQDIVRRSEALSLDN